ncbi:MAG: bifunctional 4-hydroxy-3-methylbut-2-enyl diphosphate reductase/30S ribosomal protein S1 [Oscillospiraceae bacterium]|nr:bifunctional 4-hydroxy-3-methylbut-2-enyl diphosphate reductase/30S ribosomal protein S1 [Oscillospiraceae bacterium]
MREITVASTAGFCFGVDRAVKICYDELEKGGSVATLGPIIHNSDVVADLQKKGVRIVDSVSELSSDERVIIRSHGVTKDTYECIKSIGCDYVDATCPFVSKIHRIVEKMALDGRYILIAGDKNHPEVQGILSYCGQNAQVFADYDELLCLFTKNPEFSEKRLAIVAQTTYNIIIWDRCTELIKNYCKDAEIFCTICSATADRQAQACELSKKSDVMIVVGGKHSSNTVKLCNVCSPNCDTFHIENAAALETLNLEKYRKIGITAGASTPAYIIKEVQTKMAELKNTFDEDINFEEALEQSFKKIHTGERVKGIVAAINSNEVIVDVGTKHTGYIPFDELTDDSSLKPCDVVKVGDEIDLVVIKINDAEGIATLSKKKVDAALGMEKIAKSYEDGEVIEGIVQNVVKGGLVVSCQGVRVFVPASQSGLSREANLETLLKKKVELKVIEINEQRNRAVGSIKAAEREKKNAEKAAFWATAEVGKVYKGEVKSITSYGAFVNLGGTDGMVHISELSWGRIRHPEEVVKVGDVLEVYIKDLDAEKNRISLGYKKAEDNPWVIFENKFAVGDVVDATVVSITPFGAFANIIEGIDGLIHISQVSNKRVGNVNEALEIGQTVQAKIVEIDIEKKRVSLSIRALLEEDAQDEEYSEDEAVEADEAADEAVDEAAE